jgi:hypothetical protein
MRMLEVSPMQNHEASEQHRDKFIRCLYPGCYEDNDEITAAEHPGAFACSMVYTPFSKVKPGLDMSDMFLPVESTPTTEYHKLALNKPALDMLLRGK